MIDLILGLIPHFIENLYYFVFVTSKAGPAHQFVKNLRGRKIVNKKKKISTHYRGAEKLFHWAEFFWGLSTSIGIFITIGNFLALIFPGLILWQIRIRTSRYCCFCLDFYLWYFCFCQYIFIDFCSRKICRDEPDIGLFNDRFLYLLSLGNR